VTNGLDTLSQIIYNYTIQGQSCPPIRRMDMKRTKISELTDEHKEALGLVVGGADVYSYITAIRLREVEKIAPKFIHICKPMNRPSGEQQQPYFGAITTAAGKKFIGWGVGMPPGWFLAACTNGPMPKWDE
jgi:hypothetical protein